MGDIEVVESDAQLPVRRSADQSPAAIYLARMSAGSRPAQSHALRAIAEIAHPGSNPLSFPWHALDYQHVAAIRSELAARYAPATANRALAALRGVLKEAWRLGLMSADQLQRACDVPPVRGKRLKKGRALPGAELQALFAVCPDTPAGIRDVALLAVLYSCGLRRSEAVGLNIGDYDAGAGSIAVHAGKGNKDRLVYLADWAIERLNKYVQLRTYGANSLGCDGSSAGSRDQPLFVRIHRGADYLDAKARLSAQAVRWIIRQRCEQANIPDASPHDFRRTFISDLLDAGVDISTAQQLAGHASVSTTQSYDRRGERTKRAAVQKLTIG